MDQDCCSNCKSAFSTPNNNVSVQSDKVLELAIPQEQEVDEIGIGIGGEQGQESKKIRDVLLIVFESYLKLKQKTIPPEFPISMCRQCASSLHQLYYYYLEFMKSSQELSYIRNLLEDSSVLWKVDGHGTRSQRETYFVDVPVKYEEDNDIMDHYFDETTAIYSFEDEPDLGSGNSAFVKNSSNIIPGPTRKLKRSRHLVDKKAEVPSMMEMESKRRLAISIERLSASTLSTSYENKPSSRIELIKLRKDSKDEPLIPTPATLKNNSQCPHCPKAFEKSTILRLHILKHHPKKCDLLSCDFKCSECGKAFGRNLQLLRHLGIKHNILGIVPAKFSCPAESCQSKFELEKLLYEHVEEVHKDPDLTILRNNVCVECDKKFISINSLKFHIKMKHTGQNLNRKRFPCDQCELSFNAKHHVTRHVKYVHLKLRPHVCEKCGRSFIEAQGLKAHERIHNEQRQRSFQCSTCEQSFFTANMLRAHMKCHRTENEFLCSDCGKGFIHGNSFRRHLEAVHGIQKSDDGPFVCKLCNKEFKLKEYLIQHLRAKSHGGEGHTLEKRKLKLLPSTSKTRRKGVQITDNNEPANTIESDTTCEQVTNISRNFNSVE